MNTKDYREYIFEKKEEYHRAMASLSFAKKIDILKELQKTASEVRAIMSTEDSK